MTSNQKIDKKYECKFLQWDTDYFGVNSARVNLYGVIEESEQEDIIKFCKDYEFITIANYNNLNENNIWIGNKTNAFLSDVNIQFNKEVENVTNVDSDNIYVVNNLERNQEVVEIAKESFLYSRFFNDLNLSQEQARNVYQEWVMNACGLNNKFFVIANIHNKIAGFILFSIDNDNSVIELIAVSDKFKENKVGTSLIKKMESFLFDRGINKILVGTQVNNLTAIQFYTKVGFRYSNCTSIYHLWK